MWWSLQTITTVGYGDHVPKDTFGQIVAGVVMVTGIGFISVVTASISAAFVESARRRRQDTDDSVIARLERIERALEELKAKRWLGADLDRRARRRLAREALQRRARHADAARALRGRAGRGRVAVDRQP